MDAICNLHTSSPQGKVRLYQALLYRAMLSNKKGSGGQVPVPVRIQALPGGQEQYLGPFGGAADLAQWRKPPRSLPWSRRRLLGSVEWLRCCTEEE